MIKLVKRDVRTRWHGFETAVDGVFKKYSHLIQAHRELQQDPKSGITAKGSLKNMGSIKFLSIAYVLWFTLSPSHNTQQSVSNWINNFLQLALPLRALFNLRKVNDGHTLLESLKKDLFGRLPLCQKDISIREETEINRKTNRYGESTVDNAA